MAMVLTIQMRQALHRDLLNIHPHTLHGNCPTFVISHDPLLGSPTASTRARLLATTLATCSAEIGGCAAKPISVLSRG